VYLSVPIIASGAVATDGQAPTGWKAQSTNGNGDTLTVYVLCAA
jgi:hypothetical protein